MVILQLKMKDIYMLSLLSYAKNIKKRLSATEIKKNALQTLITHTHTHTHIYIYVYIYMY